jgi:hypothetical protein
MATQYSGSFTLQQQMQAKTASNWPIAGDPYFNYVPLLLNGDGTNGAQNNTFLDSSSNNFTITRNGNTTQGSFSPYGSNWSNYFNGSDYLTASANSAFAFNTGDFTMECWYYSGTITQQSLLDTRSTSNGNGVLMYTLNNNLRVYSGGGDAAGTITISNKNNVKTNKIIKNSNSISSSMFS